MQFFAIYIFLTNFYQLGFANNKDGNVGQCTIESRSNCHTDESIGSKEDHSKGPSGIYSEETNVIMKEMRSALNEYEPCVPDDDICICHAAVIANDMKPFRKNGISKEIIESTAKYGTRYKIFNHKLYREEQCMFPARCSGVEHFIRGLLPHAKDMDLVVNTRDWPQSQGGFGKKLPVFSFSKTKDYSDIMYPAWSFWAGGPAISLHPTGIGRWDLQREKLIRAANDTSWEKKLSVGFFRGSRTSSERDSLVLLSRKRPELVNAKYTKNQAWKSLKDTLNAEPAQEVSFEDHCRYKYLFNFRGVAASFRFKHLFLCKSLIFHVGNEWQEFFYYAMKPWLHYVPLSSSPSQEEIEQIIKFFQKHDDLAKEIADRGFQFIRDHLRMKDVQCYWDHLLTEYQKLLKYEVQPDMDMKEI